MNEGTTDRQKRASPKGIDRRVFDVLCDIHQGPAVVRSTVRASLTTFPTMEILRIRFACLDLPGVVSQIERFLTQGGVHTIHLVNAHGCVVAHEDSAFADALAKASLNLVDGIPLFWASRWTPAHAPQRIAGYDLLQAVCTHAAQRSWRMFLAGWDHTLLSRVTEKLQAQYPGIHIVGVYTPSSGDIFSKEETALFIEAVRKTQPQIIWIGWGAPKQEKWAAQLCSELPGGILVGVGAAFDFIAGTRRRAPPWVQRCGCEWLFRLFQEPRRLWRRYLIGNVQFLGMLVRWSRAVKRIKVTV